LPALYISKVLLFVKKHSIYFTNSTLNHNYPTRNKDRFILQSHNTVAFEKGLLYAGQKFHNILPKNLREETNIAKFKRDVNNYLSNLSIYRTSDFT